MPIPKITGLPFPVDPGRSELTIRYEPEGTHATLTVDGIQDKPKGEIDIDGKPFRLTHRDRVWSPTGADLTIFEFRPPAPGNRLEFMSEDTFPDMVKGLITVTYSGGEEFAGYLQFDGTSWTGQMSWLLAGAPAAPTPSERARIEGGEHLVSLLWADLVETDNDGEIGFQEAAQVLADYGLGITEDGELYELDKPEGTTWKTADLWFSSVRLGDDAIDYPNLSLGCRYEVPGEENAEITRGTVGDGVQWVADIMPSRGQALLEIALQRRRLSIGATQSSFTVALETDGPEIRPRHIIVWDDEQHLVSRVAENYSPTDHDTVEVEAWLLPSE